MERTDIFEVTPGIWCVRHHRSKSCAYIVKTDPGAILVDAGPDPSAVGIMMGLQKARVGLSSVRALVLTHWHFDQCAGAAALAKRSGTSVFYSEPEAPFLTGERKPHWWERIRGRVTAPVTATHFLDDGDVIENRLEVFATPGHTEGHISCYVSDHRALIAGDALSVRTRASTRRCLEREIQWILPAHGSPIDDEAEIDEIRSRLR